MKNTLDKIYDNTVSKDLVDQNKKNSIKILFDDLKDINQNFFIEFAFQNKGSIHKAQHLSIEQIKKTDYVDLINQNIINNFQKLNNNIYFSCSLKKIDDHNSLHKRTKASDVVIGFAVVIDIDIQEDVIKAISKIENNEIPKPSIFLLTSKKPALRAQLIWRIKPTTDLKKFKNVIMQGIEFLNGDKLCKNIDRLFCMPGTFKFQPQSKKNKGRIDEFTTVEDFLSSSAVYELDELAKVFAKIGSDPLAEFHGNNIPKVGLKDPFVAISELCDGNSNDPTMRAVQGFMARGYSKEDALEEFKRGTLHDARHEFHLREFNRFWDDLFEKVSKGEIVLSNQKEQVPVDQFIFIRSENKMVDLNVNKLCDLKNLDNYYAWITKKFASKILLENPKLRRVHAIACNPEAPQIYEELGEILWNSYQPTDITPKEGDVNIFLNHIDYLFLNEKEKDHLLNWLAYCIQNPGKKIKHVVLITGGQGIGKTFIFKCMQRMLGKKNCLAVSQDQVLNKFNSFLTTCIFLACEEIHIPGDEKKQQQYMNKFKPLITEDEIMIEPKGVNAYIAKNNFNMIMFSNERSPINVEKTDRRFFILNTDARQREEKYYEELWGWLDNDGDQKLLNWMQKRNLSNFNPNAKAPMTDAKYDIRINSLTKAEEWFENAFSENIIPFTHKDIICPTHLWEYGKDSKECVEKQEFFRRKLIEKGYRKIRQVELLDKSKPALYALKDKVEVLSKMSNDELRRKYLKPVFIRGMKNYLKYDSNVFYDESYDEPF